MSSSLLPAPAFSCPPTGVPARSAPDLASRQPRERFRHEPAERLWEHYRAHGDLAVRGELIDRYIGLVRHHAIAMSRRAREVEIDELVSAGTVGLVQALEGYDPARGFAFSTYALPRIRGAMLDELRRRDWMPRTVRTRARRMEQARATLAHRLGRRPGESELAEALEIDVDTLRHWSAESGERTWIALDARRRNEWSEDSAHEAIADPAHVPLDQELIDREALEGLRMAVDAMAERDRLVLTLSFYEELTLRQIGEVLRITESRVSQIRTRALLRLREALEAREAA